MQLKNQLGRWLGGLALALAGIASGSAQAAMVSVDVANIFSNDALGAATNETRTLAIDSGAHIIGISWNVELFADVPSWLSEISVDLNNGSLTVSPGFGDDNSGSGSYAAAFDLVALGSDFFIDTSGLLRLEFFELFDDFTNAPPDNWDGIWRSGTLTITFVPEPGTSALAVLALLGMGAISRRRRTAGALAA